MVGMPCLRSAVSSGPGSFDASPAARTLPRHFTPDEANHVLKLVPPEKMGSGVFAVLFVLLLFVMLGFCGLAADTAVIYNRKAEMNGIAGSIALAAARELDGTTAGIEVYCQ